DVELHWLKWHIIPLKETGSIHEIFEKRDENYCHIT
ncbi:unnamed protein product, partial [Heterotrigona itama]